MADRSWLITLCIPLLISPALRAQDIEDQRIRDITNAVRQLCITPDRAGQRLEVEAAGAAGTIVRVVGIEGTVRFSREEWEGIRDYLSDRNDARECTSRLAPLFIEKFTSSPHSSRATDSCPNGTYYQCPGTETSYSPSSPPWYFTADSIADRISGGGPCRPTWQYRWCVKNNQPRDFYFHWPAMNLSGRSHCEGFVGVTHNLSEPPGPWEAAPMWVSEEQFEQSEIASLQRSIHELELHIRRPKERTGWPDLRCLFSENHIYSTLPQYAGETDTQPIDLVLTSTAREISETSEEIRYTIEYSDKAATGDSFAKFSFGDATVDRAPHLEGVFTLSEKPQQIEIVDVMPPQNLFASINFLDRDGNVIGSAPVFLEVPAE